MSNPNKHWSLGMALGRGLGGAIGAGGAAFAVGSLGGVLLAPVVAVIGAAGGFVGGFSGAVLGYWWDEVVGPEEKLTSAALYTMVVCGFLSAILFALLLDRLAADPTVARNGFLGLGFLSGFLSSASRSLLDDLRAAAARRRAR